MELAKIISENEIDLCFCLKEHGAKMTELRNAGFLDFVSSEQPQCESGHIAFDSYQVVNGKVVQSWEIKVDPVQIANQIENLKMQLESTDYMVTKCMEASLVGKPLPYDIESIHVERQTIRDEINRLEMLL